VTFVSSTLAIREAKRIFDESGVKFFIYRCPLSPCREQGGYIHFTKSEPTGVKLLTFNKKLLDYHQSVEEFRKGKKKKSKSPSSIMHRRRQKVIRKTPIFVWEGEGGALHPKDLED